MKLYAFLVGINEYAVSRHNLQGCLNDLQAMHDFLQKHATQQGVSFKPLVLRNEQATRKNVIEGFSHFQSAEKGDICLFYFSGHGSQAPVPPEFRESDGLVETIVCYDSRLPKGYDLLDKELGALIYSVVSNQDVHFTAIMDCCHAGNNTRGASESFFRARMAEPAPIIRKYSELWGYKQGFFKETTDVDGKKWIQLRTYPYYHLAAASANQTAKEVAIKGVTRGAFTHTLLQILQQSGTDITYKNLVTQVDLGIENLVPDQTPLFDGVMQSSKIADKALFLNKAFAQTPTKYFVSFSTVEGWKINIGSIDGVEKGAKIALQDGSIVAIKDVAPAYSVLDLPKNATQITAGEGKILDWGKPKTGIIFTQNSDLAGKKIIVACLKKLNSDYYDMVSDENAAVYRIEAKNDSFSLLKPNDPTPMFLRVTGGYTEDNADTFLESVEKVCKAEYVKNLANPSTSIRDVDIDFTIQKIDNSVFDKNADLPPFLDPDDARYWQLNPAIAKKIENTAHSAPILLNYTKVNGVEIPPSVYLRVHNRSNKTLYIGAVFCSSNYDLSNHFVPDAGNVSEVAAGGFIDLKDGNFDAITLFLNRKSDGSEIYYPDRIGSINVTAQFIISTERFDIGKYSQSGLLLEELLGARETGGQGRAAQPKAVVNRPDWRTKKVVFTIQRAVEKATFTPAAPAILNGITIKGNAKISAQAALLNTSQATREVGVSSSPNFTARGLQAFNLEEGVGDMSAMNVIELSHFSDSKQSKYITPKTPFVVELHEAVAENEAVIPLGCFEIVAIDSHTGKKIVRRWYAPVGELASDGKTINITQLPDASPDGARSISGSIKIFLQKVVMKKITHPILQQVIVKKTADLTVEELEHIGRQSQSLNDEFSTVSQAAINPSDLSQKQVLTQKIAQAKRIILFIHGIVGDTEVMAQSLKKGSIWLEKDGIPQERFIENYYDLALTFDYENLNTSISENANSLRQLLKEVGLGNNHGKELHFVAHSMGGLVSRWLIEKSCTQGVVQHLIQVGTPNNGSEISNAVDFCKKSLPKLLNAAGGFLGIPSPLTTALAWGASKAIDPALESLDELNPASPLLKYLNDGCDPEIPYSIIAGNTSLLPEEKTLWKRLISPYDYLDLGLFHEDNDMAVRVTSILTLKNSETRQFVPKKQTIACDHITYFTNPIGLKTLAAMIHDACKE